MLLVIWNWITRYWWIAVGGGFVVCVLTLALLGSAIE